MLPALQSFWLGWDQDDRHQERAAGAASPPPPDGWQAHDAQQSYEAAERDEDDLPLWAELISVLIPMLMTLALMKLVMWVSGGVVRTSGRRSTLQAHVRRGDAAQVGGS